MRDVRRKRSPVQPLTPPPSSSPAAPRQSWLDEHNPDDPFATLKVPASPPQRHAPPPNDPRTDGHSDPGASTGRRRTILAGATAHHAAAPRTARDPQPRGRERTRSAARPLGLFRNPLPDQETRATPDDWHDWDQPEQRSQRLEWHERDQWASWDDEPPPERETQRALVPVRMPPTPSLAFSAPELAAFRAATGIRRRVRVNTQRLVHKATSPWVIVRFVLALAALFVAVTSTHLHMGEPSQPLMAAWRATLNTKSLPTIASKVIPVTQLKACDQYDSYQQCLDWGDAACSAATSAEVLTAWGMKGANIGKLIDYMQPDIAMYGGLLNYHGFQRGAEHFGYRADISSSLTYKQMLYITNYLGLPLIVNVRISYGYYHYFDTGHFLVLTGGDSQGVKIVDSSEYYIHYLPIDVFNAMFTGRTALIVPKDYKYSLPNS